MNKWFEKIEGCKFSYRVSYIVFLQYKPKEDCYVGTHYEYSNTQTAIECDETVLLKILKQKDFEEYTRVINYKEFNNKFEELIND